MSEERKGTTAKAWRIRIVDEYTQRTLAARGFRSEAAADRAWERERGTVGEGLYMALPERSGR